jgi:hypothetical protein
VYNVIRSATQHLDPRCLICLALFLMGCTAAEPSVPTSLPVTQEIVETRTATSPAPEAGSTAQATTGADAPLADVLSVEVSGSEGAYRFTVEIRSPDTGCDQYADWWEVLETDGKLIYRRVLLHSHVSEQPFARSGGPIAIDADALVIVRAHMAPSGYGGRALAGSPNSGFSEASLEPGFAAELGQQEPLPADCAF